MRQVATVASVTIANGGDNLGVYIPLFAASPATVPLYAGVFAALTAVWCFLGWWFVTNQVIGGRVRRAGRVLLPYVLIATGLSIVRGAVVLIPR
jgi:cadmium resistance protein CadD (predicted permease)